VAEPPPGAVVLYADQSDVGLYPPVGAQWGERGRQYKIPTHGRNQKVYLFGALDAHSGQLYAGFWGRKDSAAFVDFLGELLAAIPGGAIHLILDNYGVHKSRRTREFLEGAGRRITLHFLPTYSPWLNRIETTWRVVKGRAGTNAWRDDLDQLTADYHATLRAMNTSIFQPSQGFLSEQGTT
jgi:transposase